MTAHCNVIYSRGLTDIYEKSPKLYIILIGSNWIKLKKCGDKRGTLVQQPHFTGNFV